MTQEFHTPYHFVPLSKWVYMPDWSHLVSHDVPFRDGVSGIIEYTLINKTPLCVGGAQDTNNTVRFAKDPLNRPVIPGSSIKGMLRSVLEIASFGKFNQFDDRQFSFRDISSSSSHYAELLKGGVSAGWIKYDNEKQSWRFTKASCCKINHRELEKSLNKKIKNDSTAIAKYQQLPLTTEVKANISEPKGKQNNRWAESLNSGNTPGHVVFTNKRIPGRGDKNDYEFSYFFYNHIQNKSVEVNRQVKNLFENHTSVTEKVGAKLLNQVEYLQASQHPQKGIPVFALMRGNVIHSLGFAKMPRVSYEHSTKDLVKNQNNAHTDDAHFDMAELIFGTLRDQELSLKSRVSFSDATARDFDDGVLYLCDDVVLNSPKPSFYPAYVEQRKADGDVYDDYSSNTSIAGNKRYFARQPQELTLDSNAGGNNENVSSRMELCPPEHKFKGKMVFHNLTPLELSALLWTIRLQGSYHQIGHGKPMGAGVVRLIPEVSLLRCNGEAIKLDDIESLFVRHMQQQHPVNNDDSWQQSPQITYLMAIGQLGEHDGRNTRYMSIDNKEYQNIKKAKAKLPQIDGLKRQEAVMLDAKQTSSAFGRGRLSKLIDTKDNWHAEKSARAEKARQAERERKQSEIEAAADAARKANMTEHQIRLDELEQVLPALGNQEKPPALRDVMVFFLENVDKTQAESARFLYQICRSNDYHKTPKKRVKEHKRQLADLLTEYGLKHD